jgi:hypothetical protein
MLVYVAAYYINDDIYNSIGVYDSYEKALKEVETQKNEDGQFFIDIYELNGGAVKRTYVE